MTLVVILLLLGGIVHHVAKRKVKGWLSTQRPVLLVGSSEQSTQVTAICALASILQGELCAIVHMALWAQSTAGRKDGPGPGAGVADLGPLPWLYGQWEAVCEAKGKVLIAWSPEATKYYECWRKTSGTESNKEEDVSLMDRLQGELEKGGQKRREELKLDQERCSRGHETEPSSVTGPVFRAALSHLHGALQEGSREHGIVLVYFKGLTHSRDIPKELRGVPQYCLPQDFCGLILELRESAATTRSPSCHCWTRLHSKTLSLWLARKFAGRLREKLPQAQKCSNKNKGHRLMAI
ncbi:interleukin-17 receptor E [Aplochiton taeniatus]